MRTELSLTALALAGCVVSHPVGPRADAGSHDPAGPDAGALVDARTGDAGGPRPPDAGAPDGGSPDEISQCTCLETPLELFGGGTLTGDYVVIDMAGCGELTLQTRSHPAGERYCETRISCQYSDGVFGVALALEHPDVIAARAASPVAFGEYVSDGGETAIHHGDLDISIYSRCRSSSVGCVPIPRGVRALQTAVLAAVEAPAADAGCPIQ